MGFVGRGGNIAIATSLPPSFSCVLYCKHHTVYGIYLFIFFACIRFQFLDVMNPGSRRPVPDGP